MSFQEGGSIQILDRVRKIGKRLIGDKLPGGKILGNDGQGLLSGKGGLLPSDGLLSGKGGMMQNIGQGKLMNRQGGSNLKILDNLKGGGQVMSAVGKVTQTAQRRVKEAKGRITPLAKEKGSMISIRSGNKGLKLPTEPGSITDSSSAGNIAMGD